MTVMEPLSVGMFSRLVIEAATASERDMAAVRRDAELFEAMFLTDDLAGMGFDDALDLVRRTKGHPKVPLLDWWESPRLVSTTPRKELRLAEAAVARAEADLEQMFSFERMMMLALAKVRARRAASLYGETPDTVRKRRARATGSREDGAPGPVASRKPLSKAFLASLDVRVQRVIGRVWSDEIEPEQCVAELRALADVIAPETIAILLDHLGCGELHAAINRVGAALRRLESDGKSDDFHHADLRLVDDFANHVVAFEEPVAADPSPAEDTPEMRQAVATLIGWLDRYAATILPMFREQGGVLRFSSTPRQPQVAAAYALAGGHPRFQRELTERIAASGLVR